MHKKLLVLLSAVLLFTGCKTASLKNGEEVVATMKGKKITADALYSELKKQGGATVLTNMIDEFIVNKEIKTDDEANKYADEQLKNYKQSYENYGVDFVTALASAGFKSESEFRETLILEYKKTVVTKNFVKKNITDEEINTYYNEKVFGDIEAKHILISPNTKDGMSDDEKKEAEEKALKQAKEIIKKLDDGEDFDSLAKKESDDKGTAANGGALTVVYGSVVDEFWDGTVALKDGEYSKEPVKSEYGYHIIYRISQKEKPKLSKVKNDILDKITDSKISGDATLQTQALLDLRDKYKLKVDDTNLKKAYETAVDNALNQTQNSSN